MNSWKFLNFTESLKSVYVVSGVIGDINEATTPEAKAKTHKAEAEADAKTLEAEAKFTRLRLNINILFYFIDLSQEWLQTF